MKKQSAGLLIYRMHLGEPQVLIAHMGGPFHAKKDVGHWSVPKGEYDPDEDPKEVARREFAEELGRKPPEGKWIRLGSVEYKNGKQVTAWAIEGDLNVSEIRSNMFEMEWPPRSGKIQKFPEIDRAEWFSLKEASLKLIPAQVEFLKRLTDKLGIPSATVEPPQQGSLF